MPETARHLPPPSAGFPTALPPEPWPAPPETPDKASKRGKFAATAIGCVHIDISEPRLAQGTLNMVLAIGRVSKSTYAEFRDDAGKMNGAAFLRGMVAAFPYAIHTVLTDNGMALADLPKAATARPGDASAPTPSTAPARRTAPGTG